MQYLPELPALPLLAGEGESPAILGAERLIGVSVSQTEIQIDRDAARAGLDRLYAAYLRGTTGAQALELAALPRLVHLDAALRRVRAICSLVLGPISLAHAIVDDQAEPIINDGELLDGLAKHLFLRRLWLHHQLERAGKPGLVWVYEPYLSAANSAFCAQRLDATLEAIDQTLGYETPRALWLAETDAAHMLPEHWRIDLLGIPLPAPEQAETIGPAIGQRLAEKTVIAWGIVPVTPEGLRSATAGRLAARFETWLRALEHVGITTADVIAASVIMPEDTLAYLEPADAERALALTAELASLIRQSYGVD